MLSIPSTAQNQTAETEHYAADAAFAALSRLYPEAAEICAPFLRRLFAAFSDGHSFIRLNEDEAAALQNAAPVVGQRAAPLLLHGRRLFLGRMWQLERDVAGELARLAVPAEPAADAAVLRERLQSWFSGQGSEGQQRAAALALVQNLMLITGGPGTGKTTTVAKLLALLCSGSEQMPRIALAAPTGKAAAHMARALQWALSGFAMPSEILAHLQTVQGQTVHRLLKLRPPRMQPDFNAGRPLPLDILVVDEASMLDLPLLLNLLRAVPDGCRLIFLGDENQLPSVGVGAALAALSQETVLDKTTAERLAELLPEHGFAVAEAAAPLAANIAKLTHSHRFGSNSGVGCLACAVSAGDAEAALQTFSDFPEELALRPSENRLQMQELYRLQQEYWQAVDENNVGKAFEKQSDIVVLAAWREDAEAFNRRYLHHLQQQGRAGKEAWFAGQMIMIERNAHDLDVYNGDIGLILHDTPSEKTAETPFSDGLDAQEKLAAYFPSADGFRKIALSRLPEFSPAFAMTVHKSQGSEYRNVWLLPPSAETAGQGALNRALLYTAVTRSGRCFTFWGKPETLAAACRRNETRRTALRELLAKAFEAV
ncbi:MAG: exodeoxyribonuclease V subunit alpha [Neisseria sp.]|nr:exodeoxyribonuclease V subunit alpha [Neisseria sp.]